MFNNSVRKGLLMDLPIDYTPACDCGHLERLE